MSEREVRFERLVDAPPEAAFHAWNDAEARVRWHKEEDHWIVEASTDLRVGGAWRVACGPSAEQIYVEDGVYEVVDPPHRVVYTCAHRLPGRSPFQTRITVTFEARGDQTLVTLVDAGFPDDEMRQEFEEGWPPFLATFARVVASDDRRG